MNAFVRQTSPLRGIVEFERAEALSLICSSRKSGCGVSVALDASSAS